jgi:ATP-dependent Clp protease adaptor protein ClpS
VTRSKPNPIAKNEDLTIQSHDLILFNDDVNTFDFVIESLIDVVGHEPEQAEQCALIAHFNGKCVIKTGPLEDLKVMSDALTLRKLSVSIY